jgi:hypothetical protein
VADTQIERIKRDPDMCPLERACRLERYGIETNLNVSLGRKIVFVSTNGVIANGTIGFDPWGVLEYYHGFRNRPADSRLMAAIGRTCSLRRK